MSISPSHPPDTPRFTLHRCEPLIRATHPLGIYVTPPPHMQARHLTHLAVCREDELAMPVPHMLLHSLYQVVHASVLHSLWSGAHHLRLIELDALQPRS